MRIEQPKNELFKFKHGLKRHPLYDVWSRIKSRCFKETDKDYSDYGGRGIPMFPKWALDFKLFYDWAISAGWEKGLEIDRKNNNLGYYPENCRFVTRSQNMRNTRRNNIIEYKGEKLCLAEWAERLAINHYTLYGRIFNYGWTIERAFNEKVRKL